MKFFNWKGMNFFKKKCPKCKGIDTMLFIALEEEDPPQYYKYCMDPGCNYKKVVKEVLKNKIKDFANDIL